MLWFGGLMQDGTWIDPRFKNILCYGSAKTWSMWRMNYHSI